MDKNQVTGLILISLLLLGYFYFSQELAPPPEPLPEQVTEQPLSPTQEVTPTIKAAEPIDQDSIIEQDSIQTFQQIEQYGDLATVMTGESTEVVIENEVVKITFNTKGGIVSQVELKDHQTFDKQPLILFDENSSEMSLLANLQGKEVDITDLYFQSHDIKTREDTTELKFSIDLGGGNEIHQHYKLGNSYQLQYRLELEGMGSSDPTTLAKFRWKDRIKRLERSLDDSRRNSSVNYYLSDGTFNDPWGWQ